MNKVEIEVVAEKMMYGQVFLRIEIVENNVTIRSTAMADGGILVDEQEKEFTNVNCQKLIDIITCIDVKTIEDENYFAYGVEVWVDDKEVKFFDTDFFYDESALTTLINAVDEIDTSKELTESIKDLIE